MNDKKKSKRGSNLTNLTNLTNLASYAIIIISILGIGASITYFVLLCGNNIDATKITMAVESTFIQVGISIIGCAIAVWAGANIVNAIERKDIDAIKENLSVAEEQLAKQQQQQREYEKNLFISELLKSSADLPTKMFAEQMQSEKAWDCNDVSYNDLLHIEQLFSQIYSMHEASDQKSVNINETIQRVADNGIKTANSLIDNTAAPSKTEQFLYFRIAEFNFYKGYHTEHTKGTEKTENTKEAQKAEITKINKSFAEKLKENAKNTVTVLIKAWTVHKSATKAKAKKSADNPFVAAIEFYEKSAPLFDAIIPTFDDEKYKLLRDDKLQTCEDEKKEISAYLCNTLGICYSKIFEQEGSEENSSEKADMKAVFYCLYAVKWSNGKRERYERNYGCALEHAHKGFLANSDSFKAFEEAMDAYQQSLYLSLAEGNVRQKSFKVWLSLYHKYYDGRLVICASPNLSGENCEYSFNQDELTILNDESSDLLSFLSYSEDARIYAHMAVTKYPDNLEFLKLQAFVYRNLAIIFHLRGKGNEAKDYFNSMDKNIENLKRICPNDTYDTYMRMLTNLRAPLHDYIFKVDCDEQ